MSLIPSEVFDKYKEFADAMIDELGVPCKVIYPKRRVPCSTCSKDGIGNKSANRFNSGGPMPLNFGSCHVCGGEGFKEETAKDDIQLRVYSDNKTMTRIANTVNVPDGSIMVIGYIYDLPKLQQANELQINIPQEGYGTWIYERDGDILPWGLKKDRYFSAILKRSG